MAKQRAEVTRSPDGGAVGPWLLVCLAALAFGALALASFPASADTTITNSSTSTLLILETAGSPYYLDHDFHVQPGGFLLVSDGVDLQVDNGARIIGDGGAISATSSGLGPALVRARVGGNASLWGGFVLQNGSELTIRHARILDGQAAVTMLGIATLDAQFAEFLGCLTWCIATNTTASLFLRDSVLSGAGWGLIERGARDILLDNVTISDFTGGGLWFQASVPGAAVSRIVARNLTVGIRTDLLRASAFGPITVTSSGPSVTGAGGADLVFHNATLTSTLGAAFEQTGSARITLKDSQLVGATRAVSLDEASATFLGGNRLTSPGGACLFFNNVTNALLRGNLLTACARPLAFGALSGPPTADVDRSNTLGGRPFLWISNAAGVEVGAFDDAGLVVISSVSGANLTDLRLKGVGLYILGSSNVRVERVLVEDADVGLTALGTRGLTVLQFTARNVGEGIVVQSGAFFASAQDILFDHLRIEATGGEGIRVSGASNVTLRSAFVTASGAAVNFTRVQGALVHNLIANGSQIGLSLADCAGVTTVDSLFSNSVAFGLLARNTTGGASRNSFVDNAGAHASAPSSPSFLFFEASMGNFWSGFTTPNVNGDAFVDIPYNLSDGTGQDAKPLVLRRDNEPAAVVVPSPVFDVGVAGPFNATSSFDDVLRSEIYWIVDIPLANDTGSGPLFLWSPNLTGNFSVRLSVVGSYGALDEYVFTVFVRDRLAPTAGTLVIGTPELGSNLSVLLVGATDNDPQFPSGAGVTWNLTSPSGLHTSGSSALLTFFVPIDQLGVFTLTVALFDRSGNAAFSNVTFLAFDTQPPEVEFGRSGEPDLGFPFTVDASQSRDPAGLNTSSALWSWADDGRLYNSTAWPALTTTFVGSGPHNLTLHLCDATANCQNASVLLDVRDRSGPRLVALRVIVPGHDPVEIAPGENIIVAATVKQEVVFEVVGADLSSPLTYTWQFGDGEVASGARVTHRFLAVGGVTVTVTMTDSVGNANSSALRMDLAGGSLFADFPGGDMGAILLFGVVIAGGAGGALFMRARSKRKLKQSSDQGSERPLERRGGD